MKFETLKHDIRRWVEFLAVIVLALKSLLGM